MLSSQWEMDYKDNQKFLYYDNENFKMAKKCRIHDLYQKLKFSYLCMILFNKIKDLYGEFTIFPSNQGGLFKENKNLEGWGSDNKYICISYTYLHGEPLLEINVHPGLNNDPEIYYGIQVQGKSYEHGIQVKGKEAEKVWEMLKKGELVIIDNWMNIPDNNKNGWEGCNQTDYNKYDTQDNTFIYQKIEIEEDAQISDVTTKMLGDLKQVINAFKKT